MPSIDDVTDTPDELSDDQAEDLLEDADLVQDMMGEVCPYPQVEAKKGLQQIDSGDLLVQETDHVPCTENVPRAVGDDADATVWRSGDATYRIYLRKR
ncbi:sulfurtransferase TusA family protein [Natronorubrum daqingense]|uniref:Preprotein translocase subunit TatB n=1 Tax=Natronorubrum daqingense TaxID=588898 RepID=A0A1N7FS23_9EURY|nr:sulfurtransferase TusA family protein [Natronorubrum daqingense]APX97384.1 preprotein translocase subunit TatB [Natronorubrum daqingense]SIS03172.1 TusA-related sulfurtransferase [Natronorubrum daqingense]